MGLNLRQVIRNGWFRAYDYAVPAAKHSAQVVTFLYF